ncbi:hypothetical protein ACBG90_19875 [Stutzerimonas kunmingensis]|uniref:hypothetical protein n=1 Tax=Stutzerimonas kunmingensis TaxID=1211807 RepID=UPI003523E0FE
MRKYVLLLLSVVLFSGYAAAEIQAKRIDYSVYVRLPFDQSSDKVVRMIAGPQSITWSSGVFDFIGERLIPSSSGADWFNKYGQATVLRNGNDESPPVWVSESQIIGGNHKLNGLSTISNYQYEIFLDGVKIPNSFTTVSGKEIVLKETYTAHMGDGVPVLDIVNQYTYTDSPKVKFAYSLTARNDIAYTRFGAAQFQKLPSTNTILFAPNTNQSCGINLTNITQPVNAYPDERSLPGAYDDEMNMAVVSGGSVIRRFAFKYDTPADLAYEQAVVRVSAKAKMYPVFYEGPLTAGQTKTTSGYFGVLPL